jgi:hypothetical protein
MRVVLGADVLIGALDSNDLTKAAPARSSAAGSAATRVCFVSIVNLTEVRVGIAQRDSQVLRRLASVDARSPPAWPT